MQAVGTDMLQVRLEDSVFFIGTYLAFAALPYPI